jgi:hypothetical protein
MVDRSRAEAVKAFGDVRLLVVRKNRYRPHRRFVVHFMPNRMLKFEEL